MVRKIIWSASAKADKVEILKYWRARNKSNNYSKKLDLLFKEAVNFISKNPGIGHLTIKENVRVKIVRDYLIIYEITIDSIYLHSIIDGRRDPKEINKIL
jgi:ParE toxin of type II toxin-antitoxin system, parDE